MWRDADFVRYFSARTVSFTGAVVTWVALPVLVYRMTGSAAWTSTTVVVETLPMVLLGLVGGALGDRRDRRRVMVRADLVSDAAIGSIALAHLLGRLTLAHLLVAAFVSASAVTIFDGSNWGALPAIVGRDRLPEANARVWGVQSLLEVGLPAAVGVALAFVAPAALLAIDAASFFASAALIRSISSNLQLHQADSRTTMLADIREGVGYLFSHPVLRPLLAVSVIGSASGGGMVALMVVWADRQLGIGTGGVRFGLLAGAWSAGAALAAALLPRLIRRWGAVGLTRFAAWVVPLCILATALTTDYSVALAVWSTYAVVHVSQYSAVITYRQQIVPDALLSRVSSTARVIGWGAGSMGGALAAGQLAERFGLPVAITAMAGVHALMIVAVNVPSLRKDVLPPPLPGPVSSS